jgi:hypothetical protein
MFFFTTFYTPGIASKPYLTLLEKKLKETQTLNWDNVQYTNLLNLKMHASKAAASFSQLKSLFNESPFLKSKDLQELEKKILEAVEALIKNQDISELKDYVRNSFSLIKNSMAEESSIHISTSICNIVTNSIYSAICIAGICTAAVMMCTGPAGMIFLGLGLTILASALLLLAAYTLYVDGRFVANKQVEEIDFFIDNLFRYNCEPEEQLEDSDDFSSESSSSIEYV